MTTATAADIDRHAESVRRGFAAMSPAPRRFTNPHPHPHPQPPPPSEAVEDVTTPAESSDQRVWREAGLTPRFDLRWHAHADISPLTRDLLSKKEKAQLAELQSALERLASEIDLAARIPLNPHKIAAAAPLGELPTTEAIEAGIAGDEGRRFRKKMAKAAATRFFDEKCRPIVLGIYGKAAALLEGAICDRKKAEEEAFELFAKTYHDDDTADIYKPSPGLIRMMSRRRMLLDGEIPHTSPPSLRSALLGVVSF